jgi:archaellum component FlaF (FlaF/FlaG flagellin family)
LEIDYTGTVLYGFVNNTNVSTSIDTNWHYVTLTYDGTDIKIYKDGAFQANTSRTGSIPTSTDTLELGRNLSGWLDEIRVSSTARSANWINTTYANQNSPSTFYSLGSEESENFTVTITVENTGKTDLKINDFDILINGTKTSFTCPTQYVYLDGQANFTVNVSTEGKKRIKVITGNGIAYYEIYEG